MSSILFSNKWSKILLKSQATKADEYVVEDVCVRFETRHVEVYKQAKSPTEKPYSVLRDDLWGKNKIK